MHLYKWILVRVNYLFYLLNYNTIPYKLILNKNLLIFSILITRVWIEVPPGPELRFCSPGPKIIQGPCFILKPVCTILNKSLSICRKYI